MDDISIILTNKINPSVDLKYGKDCTTQLSLLKVSNIFEKINKIMLKNLDN